MILSIYKIRQALVKSVFFRRVQKISQKIKEAVSRETKQKSIKNDTDKIVSFFTKSFYRDGKIIRP